MRQTKLGGDETDFANASRENSLRTSLTETTFRGFRFEVSAASTPPPIFSFKVAASKTFWRRYFFSFLPRVLLGGGSFSLRHIEDFHCRKRTKSLGRQVCERPLEASWCFQESLRCIHFYASTFHWARLCIYESVHRQGKSRFKIEI